MIRTARAEENLTVVVSRATACSVYWLIPDASGDLADAMTRVLARSGLSAWGFLGLWERSAVREPIAGKLAGITHLDAELRVGGTRLIGNLLNLDGADADWFWRLFGEQVYKHQICAALLPADAAVPSGWGFAGLQLVLAAAALQARPGTSRDQVNGYLAQAFIAETLQAGGIAATRAAPELLRPGIALTGVARAIDAVAAEFANDPHVDPLQEERSRFLGGSW